MRINSLTPVNYNLLPVKKKRTVKSALTVPEIKTEPKKKPLTPKEMARIFLDFIYYFTG